MIKTNTLTEAVSEFHRIAGVEATELEEKKKVVDAALEKYCPKATEFPPTLHQAIRYSVFAGGKRIRPILSMAAFDIRSSYLHSTISLIFS